MSACLAILVFLISPGQVDREPQQRGSVVARLSVHVAERSAQPGLAAMTYTLIVTGPVGLEVQPAQLEDSTLAWQSMATTTDEHSQDRLIHTEILHIQQVKPGPEPPPALSLRFRPGPAEQWQRIEWTDILPMRDQLPTQVPLESLSWPWWAIPACVGAGLLLLGGSLWFFFGKKPPAPITAQQWALRELTQLDGGTINSEEYHTRVSFIVRRYLEEKHGWKASRQTTKEFLESLGQSDQLESGQKEALKQLLERCDLAKFAPVQSSAEQCRQTREMARALVVTQPKRITAPLNTPIDVQREP